MTLVELFNDPTSAVIFFCGIGISTIFLITGFLTLGPLYGIVGLSIILLISTIIQVFILIYGVKRANPDMIPKI